ncbi:peptidoglycan-binding domain-containing protein [Azospirillum sp. B2RO_4]|uniref:peptidoglycan-binding domain-containing protein n=1 Tax=Azospirillum sp. B2RO_4 TaxID=3027796 RepID=UPI003DA9134B
MRGISKIVMTATAAGALFALSACGSTDTSRTATGAGTGAVAGAVVGGPVGAVVGGVGGAVAGNSMDESLSKKTDRVTDRATREVREDMSDDSSSNRSSRHRMSSGMSHEQVRELQQALNDRNDGRDIAVDGVWGANTRSALMKFQRDNGLRATGRADERTMAALNLHENGMGTSGSTGAGSTGGTRNNMNNTGNSSSMGNTGNPQGNAMPSDTPQNQTTPQGSMGQNGTK